MRTEAQKAARKRYDQSEKGKAAKKRHDATYAASGGRAVLEIKRSKQPLSEARKAARVRWAKNNSVYFAASRSKRRAIDRQLSVDDFWVLQEAISLARLREQVVGGTWHVDHIIPVSKGGTSAPENLQVVPARWNRQKSNKHSERFFACA
jgi:hypothetical protein